MEIVSHHLTLRQLQYAVAVADALSFRKAAEVCFVSQPALSAQLAQMEQALGVRLFERDRRRVIVTGAGREIIERARLILREMGDLEVLARRSVDPLSGTLRIGIIPTISPYLLPRLTTALRKAHRRLTLLWTEDKTAMLVRRLDDGLLDAALLALEAEIGDVEHEIIGSDPFVLATPLGHPLGAKASPANPAELKAECVLLLDDGHCFRQQSLAFCASAQAHELEFRATSLTTLAQMVAAGTGVTLLPELAVATEAKLAALSIRRFVAPAPKRTIGLIWRKRSPLAPALRQIAATARAAYDRMTAPGTAPGSPAKPRASKRSG
jgi:LysR family hydrogen peroxide-inducible transcriptional activator